MRLSRQNLFRTATVTSGLNAWDDALQNTLLRDRATPTDQLVIELAEDSLTNVVAVLNHTATHIDIDRLFNGGGIDGFGDPSAQPLHDRWRGHDIFIFNDAVCDSITLSSDTDWALGGVYIGLYADIPHLLPTQTSWVSSDVARYTKNNSRHVTEGSTYRVASRVGDDFSIEAGDECLLMPDNDSSIFRDSIYGVCSTVSDQVEMFKDATRVRRSIQIQEFT